MTDYDDVEAKLASLSLGEARFFMKYCLPKNITNEEVGYILSCFSKEVGMQLINEQLQIMKRQGLIRDVITADGELAFTTTEKFEEEIRRLTHE